MLFLIEAILTKNGFAVIKAVNGHDGVEAAEKIPDLILCDIMMEKIDAGTAVPASADFAGING